MSVRLITKSIWCNPGNRGQRFRRTAAAALWQTYKQIVRKPRVIHLANGRLLEAHPDCVVSSSLIYADYPEYEELQFIRSQIDKGDKLIDVGANVGHIGLLLSDIIRPEDIIAFEPTPVTFGRLQQNWELNPGSMPQLFQMAVGESEDEVLIPNPSSPDTVNALVRDTADDGRDLVAVPIRPIDAFRDQWSGRTIGLIKIDVEGFEPGVFAGARETLRHDRPGLVMFESLDGRLDKQISESLHEAEYEVFQLDDEGVADFGRCDAQNLFAIPRERHTTLRQ